VRVLLTGASGFVGRHALDALVDQGHEVHAVARRAGALREGVVWHEADLLQPGVAVPLVADAAPSHLLHLGWYAVPGSFWTASENERWIDATLRLLRAFGEGGGKRAVMAGSCAEYAWGEDILRERDTPLEPATLYGACKHATHVAAKAVAAQLGVSLAWGRMFFLYGQGEHPDRLVSSVARGLLAGEEVATTSGEQRRDFMDVRDVAAAFLALLESPVTGPVNISSGEGVAVRDVVMLIAQVAGGVERLLLGALPQRQGEPPVIVGEAGRLTREVGFVPTFDLRKGIADAVAWWRHAGERTATLAPDRDEDL
jgi:nucleoside-diphosphate-sugar epimerase